MEVKGLTYRIGMLLFLMMIVLGGCQMGGEKETKKPSDMKEEDLPDVQAFDDEFTRDFLQSTEETREGHYPFVSGTGNYKFDFPAEGVIGEKAYSKKKKGYEEFPIHIEGATGSSLRINYYAHRKTDQLKKDIDAFRSRIGYDGEFKKIEEGSRLIYYSNIEENGFDNYFGYILSDQNMGAIETVYEIDCRGEKEEICKENKQRNKEHIMNWMKSVQFINDKESDDNHE